ncbi:TetR/AcrR family transcriptional regulator [Nocardia sp. NPDC020380]|uniref:TetR/AcrR family transcriptional regulator n=1 Tax=Nocardia sp. NPDC020380 TaxID=3364309 RepID=UPI0037B78CF1
MADPEVPGDLVRLWRLRAGPRLGRPAELDVDRVVNKAVELADGGGVSAASLPKIAAALKVTPMSLYRHIGSKDELTILMADAAQGPPPVDLDPAAGWRAALRRWAEAHRAVCLRHPWLAQLPISGPPRGPNAIGWMDAGLGALRDTGLNWPSLLGVIFLLDSFVRQSVAATQQLEDHRSAAHLDESQALRAYRAELSPLVDPARFPHAAALFASGLFDAVPQPETSGDEEFTFGLDLILDGVAAQLPRP